MRNSIPIIPLLNGVFPDGMLPLQIFEVRYLDLIKRCYQLQQPFGVAWIKHGNEVQVPGQVPILHTFGCTALIRDFDRVRPTLFHIWCQGSLRFELHDIQPGPYGVWIGNVTYLAQDPEVEVPQRFQTYADRLGKVISYAQEQGVLDELPIFAPYCLNQCGWLANRYAEAIRFSADLKQQFLRELDPLRRLESVINHMQKFDHGE